MQKNFTLSNLKNASSKSKVGPKESTVSFIKQFARICKMKQLPQPELSVFVLN